MHANSVKRQDRFSVLNVLDVVLNPVLCVADADKIKAMKAAYVGGAMAPDLPIVDYAKRKDKHHALIAKDVVVQAARPVEERGS